MQLQTMVGIRALSVILGLTLGLDVFMLNLILETVAPLVLSKL